MSPQNPFIKFYPEVKRFASGPGFRIRAYERGDYDAIRRICCDTALLGMPIDPVYRDRELFAELITAPYLAYEPEWTLVGESEGRVIGYLMASVSPLFFQYRAKTGARTLARIVCKLLRGRYSDHPRSERFARWLLYRAWLEEPVHPKGAAHMHFSLERDFRGMGVAWRFWKTFETALVLAGKRHYYGQCLSSRSRNLERIFLRFGLNTYSRAKTTIFDPDIPGLEMVCMHKRL